MNRIFLILLFLFSFTQSIALATTYFEFDGENGYQYLGSSHPHPGGGYFEWLGGTVEGPEGTGCQDPHGYHNTILTDEIRARDSVPGSLYALKTPYSGSCPNESFGRDTTIINLDADKPEIFIRWYQKWTGDWNSATVQQKFAKFRSLATGGITTQFSFGPGARNWRAYVRNIDGRFDLGGIKRAEWVWVYATREGAGQQYEGVNRVWDDINNRINGGEDGEFFFSTNRWYCIEIHVKMNSDPDAADGVVEAWVDGTKIHEIRNMKFYSIESERHGTGQFELQHIYYDRSSTDQPTYMDNIVISDHYIGPFTQGSTPPPPPSLLHLVE